MALNDDADDTPDSQPPLVRTVSFSLVMTSETETVLPRGGCESGGSSGSSLSGTQR